MARRTPKPLPTRTETLECIATACLRYGTPMWVNYENTRVIVTLQDVVKLRLRIRRCQNPECDLYHKPYRPECEGSYILSTWPPVAQYKAQHPDMMQHVIIGLVMILFMSGAARHALPH